MAKFIRRLQKVGSSILVSLPIEWITANKLEKSDEVELETGTNSISITPTGNSRPPKEVVIEYPVSKKENISADITGAYLLGYDIIKIKGKSAILVEDREKIRGLMRRLVGMEIVDEDATNVNVQFLLDSTTLSPEKILKRMSSIAFALFRDTINSLVSDDKTVLQTIPSRDDEIDRQYFLLVRLIRSALVDKRLATIFNLGNIDILDYRIAANLMESAGDTIVELANSIPDLGSSKTESKKLHSLAVEIENIHDKATVSFIENNRLLAIEAITSFRNYQKKISDIMSSLESRKQVSLQFLDLVYTLEKLARCWADIADLVKPVYK
ncbi:MAG TPA: phosphate uptake regulator PhoU [Candidatus Nitrosotalea sp.]|nr:phosphate uptake regulator PhoU [Nitrososphaerota archaeon]HKU32372.1 phosphate uptake regulator PhoU [Candidatus Nitrosotalea sp.]